MSIIIYDSAGNAISRTLPELQYGNNLLIFSPIGCKRNSALQLEDFKNFVIRVYINEDEDIAIKPGNFIKFNNAYELYKYLERSDYSIVFGNT